VSDLDGLAAHAARAFAARFGPAPAWAAAAPGRVNLIGEHTDYNQGFVLPMAIDRWCVCVAAPAAGARSRLVALDINESIEVSLTDLSARGAAAAGELPAWGRYLAGALVERRRSLAAGAVPELDLLATSTVPVGGGLSSSAAIETAAAVLIEQALGVGPPPVSALHDFRLARALDCQRAEHRWAGVPCGLMDQLASSFGEPGHALLIDCRDNTVTPVPMPPEDQGVVLVVNSGVHHALAAGEYARRRAACEAAAAALGVASLRDLNSLDAVAWSLLDAEQTRCVRHVVSENSRTLAAAAALRAGDLSTLGRLMLESHASLRDDYRVSCAELDAIVDLAGATPGVHGARMTGGGFGGCAVVLAEPGAAEALERTLRGDCLACTDSAWRCERVVAAGGACAIRPGRR
jgi:galactokinase